MIVDKYLKMPITNRNITYYKNKGYDCHISETIDVSIDDINPGSPIKERRICDVCGQEYIREHRKMVELPRKLTAEEEEFLNSDW